MQNLNEPKKWRTALNLYNKNSRLGLAVSSPLRNPFIPSDYLQMQMQYRFAVNFGTLTSKNILGALKDWSFLPVYLKSLDPYDRLFTR